MSGLRERKKERNRKNILDAATQIICEKGFDATTIEEVAKRADVGVGTVYNYFDSKSHLLIAIVTDEIEGMMAGGHAVIENHSDDVLEALGAVLQAYLAGLLHIDRRILSEAVRIGFSKVGMESKALIELDYRLIGQLAELIAYFQGKGLIDKGHSPQDQAFAVYSGVMVQVLMLVFLPDIDVETVREGMHRHVEILVNGLRARPTVGDANA
jgi:AcrR family transcriptional regulator